MVTQIQRNKWKEPERIKKKKKKEANVTQTINICLFSILFLVSLKELKDIKL